MKRTIRLVCISAIAVAVLAAAAPATARTDAAAAGSVARVQMADGLRFLPARIRIARGDAVRWTNTDNLPHTSTGPTWNSGSVGPGSSFRKVFRRAGTFRYRCTIHGGMTGRVIVG